VVDELNNMPVKAVNGAVIYIRDVAHVRDGNPPQTNIVRVDGSRAILMSIMKTGSSSTLDIIKGVHERSGVAPQGHFRRNCRSRRSRTNRFL
jgi:multidrug efflux pump subunit AcrB